MSLHLGTTKTTTEQTETQSTQRKPGKSSTHFQNSLCALCVSVCSVVIPVFAPQLSDAAQTSAVVPTSQESIDSIRQTLALEYDNPNAHLGLARRLREQGDGLSAFLICERVRTLFGDDAFHASFAVVFRGQITDLLFHARKQVLQEAIKVDPKNATLLREIGALYEAHGEPDYAAASFGRAHWLAPDDYSLIQSMERETVLAAIRTVRRRGKIA
jgi:hypothetical protein